MAIYNNGYPVNYPQMYMMPQQQQQQPQQTNSIIWVQGEAGAKSYLVAPNNTVQLWDSENNVIYLKSADSSGMPSIKVLDYTIRENPSQMPQNGLTSHSVNYVTKEEFENFKEEVMKSFKKEKEKKEDKLTDGEFPF